MHRSFCIPPSHNYGLTATYFFGRLLCFVFVIFWLGKRVFELSSLSGKNKIKKSCMVIWAENFTNLRQNLPNKTWIMRFQPNLGEGIAVLPNQAGPTSPWLLCPPPFSRIWSYGESMSNSCCLWNYSKYTYWQGYPNILGETVGCSYQ